MITYPYRLAGDRVEIHALEPGDDEQPAIDFINHNKVLAIDVETTHLNVYGPGFALRLAQISDGRQAWVLRGDVHTHLIAYAALCTEALIVHNAAFDLAVLDRLPLDDGKGIPLEHTCTTTKTMDTAILSRIVDPLGGAARRGGKLMPRHGLKDLARKHIDPDLDFDKALSDRLRTLGLPPKSAGGFAAIPVDDPAYVVYAGLDAIITYRLCHKLMPRLTPDLRNLITYETRLTRLLAEMTRRGILVDVAYTQAALKHLRREWEVAFAVVAAHGLDSTELNTTVERERFAALLRDQGVQVGATKTGQPALSKQALTDALNNSPASAFAEAFFRCRDLHKTARDYCHKFLDMRDAADRLHPAIQAMGAQTGRMSISDPPLQQIPRAGNVRGCLIAEPGHVLVAADYSQIEFRCAAALTGETAMKKAINNGIDLHAVTARRLFGAKYTDEHRDDVRDNMRTIAKRAGFGRLYGAGARAVALQCGVEMAVAERALAAFDAEYPAIPTYVRQIANTREITTPTGRRLPLDARRSHIGINYLVQSTARDVFAQAMLRLAGAGFSDHLWLPIHDEVIVSVPETDADDAAHAMEQVMADELDGVPIVAEAKVLGRRWRKSLTDTPGHRRVRVLDRSIERDRLLVQGVCRICIRPAEAEMRLLRGGVTGRWSDHPSLRMRGVQGGQLHRADINLISQLLKRWKVSSKEPASRSECHGLGSVLSVRRSRGLSETTEEVIATLQRFGTGIPDWQTPAARGVGRSGEDRQRSRASTRGNNPLPGVVLATLCSHRAGSV